MLYTTVNKSNKYQVREGANEINLFSMVRLLRGGGGARQGLLATKKNLFAASLNEYKEFICTIYVNPKHKKIFSHKVGSFNFTYPFFVYNLSIFFRGKTFNSIT